MDAQSTDRYDAGDAFLNFLCITGGIALIMAGVLILVLWWQARPRELEMTEKELGPEQLTPGSWVYPKPRPTPYDWESET